MTLEQIERIKAIKAMLDALASNPTDSVIYNLLILEVNKLDNSIEELDHAA